MQFKLVALDLDGTLLQRDHSLSAANAAAVRACVAAGVQVVLASGRSFDSIRPYAQMLELDGPIIGLNGAVVGDAVSGTLRPRRLLNTAQIDHVAEALLARSIPFVVFGARAIYALPDMPRRDELVSYNEPPATVVPVLHPPHLPDPLKVLSFLSDHSFDEELRSELEPEVTQVRTGPLFLEWLSPGVSKGDALQELMAQMGLAPEQVLAIGDSQNDISMFEVVGLSIAMGDAAPEVRERAMTLTAPCGQDGVAVALRQYVV